MISEIFLKNISTWKLEAGDDPDTYFLPTAQYKSIKNGESIFVIGRKGTGKTAIFEHIHRHKNPDEFSITQSFKNFPFNEIYRLKNDAFGQSNQYITVWKYVILTALCRLMIENRKIDAIERKRLEKIFTFDLEETFDRRFRKITNRSFSFQVLGNGLTAGQAINEPDQEIDISIRTDVLENYVLRHLDDKKYFVLFDALDDDYSEVLTVSRKDQNYFDLLKGLFKAAQEINRSFNQKGKSVFPVVFLRNDIYDLIRDNDKAGISH